MPRSERYRTCSGCGKIIPAKGESYYCDECRLAIKRGVVVRPRICKECGSTFDGGPRAWYCPRCRKEREAARAAKYRKEGFTRHLGDEYICERCGKPYILESGRQRYCKECAPVAIKDAVNPLKREYQRNYDPDHAKRRAVKEGNRLCVICGKPIPPDRAGLPIVTCSEACGAERRRLIQNEADIKRGKRRSPASARFASGLPRSGIVGVTYHRSTGKWQAKDGKKYIGLYGTVEEAAAAIKANKEDNND